MIILEADTIKQMEVKNKIPKEYLMRTRKLHETKLSSQNLIKRNEYTRDSEGFFLYYDLLLVISYHSVWLGLELFRLVNVQVNTLISVHARARNI